MTDDTTYLLACGCFSPPHLGHLNTWICAADEIKKINPNENITIIVSPVCDTYEKSSIKKFTYKKRTELLKKLIATQNKYNIIVSHNNQHQQHSTADEILLIEKQYMSKPYLVCACDLMKDALDQTNGWKLPDNELIEFLENNTFVVACGNDNSSIRGYYDLVNELFETTIKEKKITSKMISFKVDLQFSEISSSEIIKSIMLLQSTIGYTLPDIFNIIQNN